MVGAILVVAVVGATVGQTALFLCWPNAAGASGSSRSPGSG